MAPVLSSGGKTVTKPSYCTIWFHIIQYQLVNTFSYYCCVCINSLSTNSYQSSAETLPSTCWIKFEARRSWEYYWTMTERPLTGSLRRRAEIKRTSRDLNSPSSTNRNGFVSLLIVVKYGVDRGIENKDMHSLPFPSFPFFTSFVFPCCL